MKFTDLSTEEQEAFHKELSACTEKLGGRNFLLQLIEDVKAEKESPLTSKEKRFSFSKGSVQWNKSIYKDTLDLLFKAIARSEREEGFMEGLKEREQKRMENMLKTLSPVSLQIKPANAEDGEGFAVSIVQRVEGKTSNITLLFRTLFFYNVDFAKKALGYTKK